MRIFDCVVLAGELDLLEDRFRELADISQVTHVICERRTAPGPRFADCALTRFAPWNGRWNHVMTEPGELGRGASLREYLWHGINGDGIILHGDIREIPSAWAVRDLAGARITVPALLMTGTRGTAAQSRDQVTSFARLRRDSRSFPEIPGAGRDR